MAVVDAEEYELVVKERDELRLRAERAEAALAAANEELEGLRERAVELQEKMDAANG